MKYLLSVFILSLLVSCNEQSGPNSTFEQEREEITQESETYPETPTNIVETEFIIEEIQEDLRIPEDEKDEFTIEKEKEKPVIGGIEKKRRPVVVPQEEEVVVPQEEEVVAPEEEEKVKEEEVVVPQEEEEKEIEETTPETYSSTWERLYYYVKLPAGSPQSAQNALKTALKAAEYHDEDRLNRITWMKVVDFSQHSIKKRGYLINLKTGVVQAMRVSHGSNSGGTSYANKFSNIDASHQSSLGLYLTKDTYNGSHKYSLRLEGLQSTNDNALTRLIVIHGAHYVAPKWVEDHEYTGRSWGCPAVDPALVTDLINKIKGGSYYYIYHDKLSNK